LSGARAVLVRGRSGSKGRRWFGAFRVPVN